MAYDGSGNFNPLYNWTNDAANNINIRADRMDGQDSDIATGLTKAICKDGQTTITANLPMATYRHTGVGNAVNRTDYVAYGQYNDGIGLTLDTVAGTGNAITANLTPVISAYATNQTFRFVATASNSGATTIAINGLAAKAIKKNITVALETGDIQNGQVVTIFYDGTNFQLIYDLQNKNINMNAKVLTNAEILNYSETSTTSTAASTTTLDLSTATFFDMTHGANITTFTWSNPSATTKAYSFTLKRTKDASGTTRTIAWPASVKWAAGTAPTLTQTTGAVDIFTFVTIDNGTTYDGFTAGLGMA